LAISDLNISKEKNRKLVGQFTTLGEGKDLLLEASDDNYQDKIVFVGKYLHTDLLHDLFEKGALFVLTYSMDYEDFRKQGLPVGVVGGFGEMYSSMEIIERISSMDKKLVVVDYEESQLFFVTDDTRYGVNKEVFVRSAIGSIVISRSLSNYGMLGNVVSMEDEQYITVEWDGGQRSMVNIASVEFVSF